MKFILAKYEQYPDVLRTMLLDGDKDGDTALHNACDYGVNEAIMVGTKEACSKTFNRSLIVPGSLLFK